MNLAEYLEALPWGGKKVIALRLGVTASYLSRLVSGDRSITAERAIQIEDATGGAVTRSELRPDIQWSPASRKNCSSEITLQTMDGTVQAACNQRISTAGAGVLSSCLGAA